MSGPRSLRRVELDAEDRGALEALTRRTTAAVGLVRRARIVLQAAGGVPLDRIARELGPGALGRRRGRSVPAGARTRGGSAGR